MQEARDQSRPRTDAAGSFRCGCGKSYKSYPALYTHVKNKHQGVFPLGSNARRKLSGSGHFPADFFQPSPAAFEQEFRDACLGLGPAPNRPPLSHWNGFQAQFEAISAALEESALPTRSAARLLAHFARFVRQAAPPHFYHEYLLLLVFLLRAIEERGATFNCADCPRLATEILNLFTAELFPRYLRLFQSANPQAKLQFLGFEEEQILHLIVMAKLFAGWLFHHGLIDYRLEVNVE